MAKKKELGQGIRALLSNIEGGNISKEKGVRKLTSSVGEIKISKIIANPNQPRTLFDKNSLEELSHSIKIHGVIQPLTVRSLGDGNYQLISGERRFRAAKKAGIKSIPAYVRVADDQGLLEMALVENIQRKDLNALEISFSLQRLIDECNLTHKELSGRLGKQRSTITNYLRLLKLPPQIQEAVKAEKLSMGHARCLAGVENPASQLILFRKILDKGLSVRQTESLVSEPKKKKVETSSSANSPEINRISRELSAHFGTKVALKRNNNGKGQIVIPFNNDDELNDILDIIKE